MPVTHRRWRLLAAAVLGLLLAPATAAAEERGFTIGARPVWFLTAGGTGGGTVGPGARGGFIGGELSLVRLREHRLAGLYADAYHDFGVDGTYVTAGPELGLVRRSRTLPLAVGVDGGAVVRFADERAFGATGRLFVAVAGTLAVYARYAYLDADADDHVIQVGMTFKFPFGPPFGAATR